MYPRKRSSSGDFQNGRETEISVPVSFKIISLKVKNSRKMNNIPSPQFKSMYPRLNPLECKYRYFTGKSEGRHRREQLKI
jgi:hypothetical protein